MMTPIKSKFISKIETIVLIHDDSDDGDGAEDNGSDGSLSEDEELVALKKIGWHIFFPGDMKYVSHCVFIFLFVLSAKACCAEFLH
jgi:hypothetical protein